MLAHHLAGLFGRADGVADGGRIGGGLRRHAVLEIGEVGGRGVEHLLQQFVALVELVEGGRDVAEDPGGRDRHDRLGILGVLAERVAQHIAVVEQRDVQLFGLLVDQRGEGAGLFGDDAVDLGNSIADVLGGVDGLDLDDVLDGLGRDLQLLEGGADGAVHAVGGRSHIGRNVGRGADNAIGDRLFEPVGARFQIGHRLHQRRVDGGVERGQALGRDIGAGGDRLGQGAQPLIDHVGDRLAGGVDAGLDDVGGLAGAFAHGGGGVVDAGGDTAFGIGHADDGGVDAAPEIVVDLGNLAGDQGRDGVGAVAHHLGDVLQAHVELVAHGGALGVDGAAQFDGAIADGVGDAHGVAAERIGELLRTGAEGLGKLGRAGGDGAGELLGPAVEGRPQLARTLFEGVGQGAGMAFEGRGDLLDAALKRLRQCMGAGLERAGHFLGAAVEGGRHVLGALFKRGVEELGARIKGARQFIGAAAQGVVDQLGAVVERVGEDAGVAFERVRQLAGAVADGVGDLLDPGPQRLGHLAGTLADDVVEVAGLVVERHFEDVGPRGEGGVVLVEIADELFALVADYGVERLQAGVDDRGDLIEARVELRQRARTGARQGDAGPLHAFIEIAADFDEGRMQPAFHGVDVDRDAFVEALREGAEHRLGIAGALGDVGGDAGADEIEGAAHFVTAVAQLVEQGRAAFGQQLGQ